MRPDPRTEQRKNERRQLSRACVRVQANLLFYLDGDLRATPRQGLEQHLAACGACRQELQRLQEAEQALAGARSLIPAPGDLRDGFYARLAAANSTRPRRIDWRLAVPALAACSLALGWFSTMRPHGVSPATSPDPNNPQVAQTKQPRANNAFGALPAAPNKPNDSVALNKPTTSHSSAAPNKHSTSHDSVASSNLVTRNNPVVSSGQPIRNRQSAINNSERLTRPAHRVQQRRLIASAAMRQHTFWDGERDAFEREKVRLSRATSYAATPAAKQQIPRLVAGAAKKYARSREGVDKTEAVSTSLMYRDQGVTKANSANWRLGVPIQEREDSAFKYGGRPAGSAAPMATGAQTEALAKEAGDAVNRSFSLSLAERNKANYGYAMGLASRTPERFSRFGRETGRFGEALEADGVSLQIRDEKRGFTSGTRLASQVSQQSGRQVLTLDIDDDMPSPAAVETEQTAAPTKDAPLPTGGK